jgi:DNA-binding MarR family transcriptional regulator
VRLHDRLEAAGWVERRPDPSDRRARQLFLKEKARPVLDQLMALAAETRAVALQGISEAEHELLIEALIKVRTNHTRRELAGEKAANGAAAHNKMAHNHA